MTAPELASVDGVISLTSEARIPPGDDGLLRGDGVFEVIRLYGGAPFALVEHYDRLERSAAAIELEVPRRELESEVVELLKQVEGMDCQLRLVVTRGGRRLAFIENFPPHGESVKLATIDYTPTIILTGVKSLSYGANMQATRLAKRKGSDEAVLVRPDGVVLEAPTSTIFWARDGALRTPAIETGILASITRDRLVRELEVEEGEYPLDDLLGADEAFLASTVREVQPISAIDDTELDAAPGPLTEGAQKAFQTILDRELPVPSTSTGG